MTTLKAETRDKNVKAKRLRREGYVTGNVFGREITGSIPVKIGQREVERLLKTSNKDVYKRQKQSRAKSIA